MNASNVVGYALAALVITVHAQAPVPAKRQVPVVKKSSAVTAAKPAPAVSTPVQPSGEMIVNRAAIALDVVDREPKDTGTVFPPEVKRLYCFTEISNGEGEEIQHRWYWNDELLNTVSLKITSARYRTYSAKTIVPGMVGDWRVAVVDSKNEAVLQMVNFEVK